MGQAGQPPGAAALLCLPLLAADCYASATDVHTIPKPSLHRRRGRLAGAEMASLEQAIRTYLGL